MTFQAYNHIQNFSDSFFKVVEVLGPVQGLAVQDWSNDTIDAETKKFYITIKNVGTNSCLLIDYGDLIKDASNYHTYGDLMSCKKLFPKIPDATHSFKLVSSFEAHHKYSKPNNYLVKFLLANSLSQIEERMTITVIGKWRMDQGCLVD